MTGSIRRILKKERKIEVRDRKKKKKQSGGTRRTHGVDNTLLRKKGKFSYGWNDFFLSDFFPIFY